MTHKHAMFVLVGVNFMLFAITALFLVYASKYCPRDQVLYFLTNLTSLGAYCFLKLSLVIICCRLGIKAEMDSADVLIFDTHVSFVGYFTWVPIYIGACHFILFAGCGGPFIGNKLLLLMNLQAVADIVFLRLYLKWHQIFIKQQEGFLQ